MLWEYIKSYMSQYPNQKLYCGGESITYAFMINEVERLSKKLTSHKYGINCKSNLNSAKSLLACFAAGVTAVPMSSKDNGRLNQQIINTCEVNHILNDENNDITVETLNNYKESETVICTIIFSTSGSSGKPKGAMIGSESIKCQLINLKTYYKLCPNDRVFLCRGLYHCGSIITELLYSLICGTSVYFYEGSFSPELIINELSVNKITAFTGTPTMLHYLAKAQKRMNAKLFLNYCTSVGEIFTETILSEVRNVFKDVLVINAYGLSETCGRIAYHYYKDDDEANCIGKVISDVEYKIVDSTYSMVPQGTVGELLLCGIPIMLGYYADIDKTSLVLKDGWFKTGDFAYVDEVNNLHVLSRKDNMIIRAGVNIYPAEIENVIIGHKGVNNVVVLGKKENDITEHIIAYVEPVNHSETINLVDMLYKLCKDNLPNNRIPDKILIVDELPRTVTGKIMRVNG